MKTSISSESLEIEILRKIERTVDFSSEDRRGKVHALLRIHILEFLRNPANGNLEAKFLELCKNLGEITNIHIEGRGNFKPSPSLIIGNHLGANKLVKVSLEDVDGQSCSSRPKRGRSLKNNDHFMMLFFPFVETVRQASEGKKILPIPILMNYEDELGLYASSHGFTMLKENSLERMPALCFQIEKKIELAEKNNATPIVLIFPEGGTSGKLSSRGPYDLERFYSGFLKLSEIFNLEIQAIICAFSKSFQFHTEILCCDLHINNREAQVDYYWKNMQCSLSRLVKKIA